MKIQDLEIVREIATIVENLDISSQNIQNLPKEKMNLGKKKR